MSPVPSPVFTPSADRDSRDRFPVALLLACGAAAFDNLLVGSLLVAIADDVGRTLPEVAAVASGYFVAYGLTQLAWARLADRVGRLRAVTTGLVIAAFAAAVAAVAGPLWVLVAARIVGAAALAAVVPASLTWAGERATVQGRPRAAARLVSAYAGGIATAAAAGALLARAGAWRSGFALSAALLAVAAVAVWVTLRHRDEALSRSRHQPLRAALGQPGVVPLVLLAAAWGAVMLGGLALLVPALIRGGADRGAAGLVLVGYGAAVLTVGALPPSQTGPTLRLLTGGVSAAAGFAIAATGLVGAAFGALFLGLGFALVQPALISWAVALRPAGAGTVVGLLATAFFCGQAGATQAMAGLVDARPGVALTVMATGCLAFAVLASVVRGRVRRTAPHG